MDVTGFAFSVPSVLSKLQLVQSGMTPASRCVRGAKLPMHLVPDVADWTDYKCILL